MTTVLLLILARAFAGFDASDAARQANPAVQPAKVEASDAAQQLDSLYDEFWEESLRLNPLQATFVGDPRYNAELPNVLSADHRAREEEFHKKWLARVQKIDGSRLTGQARLSYDIFVRDRQRALEANAFPRWMIPINQFQSFATFAPQLGSGTGAQPFKTVKDYDDWLARAGKIPALFDQAIANMREGMRAGVVQPKVLMQKVWPQLDALVKEKPEDSLFWQPVAKMPAEFAEADRTRLTAAFRELVSKDLMPAYKRLRAFIADEYLAACRDTVGLDALPNGKAWYAFNVRTQTTTDLAPDRIHQIGLDEVTRIHGEMRKVMAEVGFKGDLPAFFKHVTSDPRFTFSSEEALLEAYNAVKARVDAGTPRLFSLTPKAPFEIRPVEAFRAESAAGGQYFPPSEDGSRPGIFYVNTHDLPARKTWEMESLFLHEAIPGHHFQIALQQELRGLPKFRRFGGQTVFIEGWGLYAESLGKEMGLYTDPYQYFGRLQAELWRAIRLVVDTGLHSKGWTREAVIRYMLESSAATETHAVAEAERYIAIPGQALAYKIGELKIKELRARAERALGAGFDERAFHREVLQDGSVPLGVLESKTDRWIAAERQAASRTR